MVQITRIGILISKYPFITVNNRRSGGQRLILCGWFNGRSGYPVAFGISCRCLHINWINRTYKGNYQPNIGTVQITFIFMCETHLVFGKCVCTCVRKHSNEFRTSLNWLKNLKCVWHEKKIHVLRLPWWV